MYKEMVLPANFRKKDPTQRLEIIQALGDLTPEETGAIANQGNMMILADKMVENAIGIFGVPLGVAPNFKINGETRSIPMATEEPSVIAAASFAGSLISRKGGFTTKSTDPIMIQQIFLNSPQSREVLALSQRVAEIKKLLEPLTASMDKRGGGIRSLNVSSLDEEDLYRLELLVDVRDAMGANLLNTLGEALTPWVEEQTKGEAVMTILSNSGEYRRAEAHFSLPFSALGRGGYSGEQIARRITAAARIAQIDPHRGVTHNKGILNGVSALALATGNDTRGVEASIHSYAAREGSYCGLSTYSLEGENLVGHLEIPVLLGTVGGSIGAHPASRAALKILGSPNSRQLGEVAAALGLAQNFASLFALVSEGIQKGHMALHRKKENH